MIEVYTNLDVGYMDEVALRNAGMERKLELKDKKIYKLEPSICPICHKVNLLGSRYCLDCRHLLTKDAQEEVQTTTQQIQTAVYW